MCTSTKVTIKLIIYFTFISLVGSSIVQNKRSTFNTIYNNIDISSASECIQNLTYEFSKTKNLITILICNVTNEPGLSIISNVLSTLHNNPEYVSFTYEISNGTQIKMNSFEMCVNNCNSRNTSMKIFKSYFKNTWQTQIYLVFIDNLQDFENNLKKINFMASYNISAEFILFYTNIPNNTKVLAEKILKIAYNHSKYIATLLIPSARDIFDMYVFDLYAKDSIYCGAKPVLTLLNTCNQGKFNFTTYRHIPNFNKLNCTIRVELVYTPPFVVSSTDGIEVRLLKQIENRLNITFEMIYYNTTLRWGSKQSDGNWSGILRRIYNDHFRIGVGSVALREDRLLDFDFSLDYFSEEMFWVVPRAEHVNDGSLLLFMFTRSLWIVLLVFLVIIAVFFWIVSNVEREWMPIQDNSLKKIGPAILFSLQISLSNSVVKHPSLFANRMIFITYVLFYIVISSLYQSALINILTKPKHKHQIKTYDEILKSSLEIGGISYVQEFFHTPENEKAMIIYHKYNSLTADEPPDFWRNMVADGNAISILGNTYLMYYAKRNELSRRGQSLSIYVVDHEVFVDTFRIIFSKNFILKNQMDNVIEKVIYAGFIGKWTSFYSYKNVHEAVKKMKRHNKRNVPLTMKHLKGAFIIILTGNFLACCVFIFERFLWK